MDVFLMKFFLSTCPPSTFSFSYINQQQSPYLSLYCRDLWWGMLHLSMCLYFKDNTNQGCHSKKHSCPFRGEHFICFPLICRYTANILLWLPFGWCLAGWQEWCISYLLWKDVMRFFKNKKLRISVKNIVSMLMKFEQVKLKIDRMTESHKHNVGLSL